MLIKITQIDGHQRRLPVVAMDDVGASRAVFQELQRRHRKRRETMGVVRIVLPLHLIEAVTIKILRAIDQVGLHAVGAATILHSRELVPDTERQGQTLRVRHDVPGRGDSITRQYDFHLVPQGRQRLGQRSYHIRQTTRLGKRNAF